MQKYLTQRAMVPLIGMVLLSMSIPSDFLSDQKKYERVRTAIKDKQDQIEKSLLDHQISLNQVNVLFVAYKDDDLLEIYAKSKTESTYKKIKSYAICYRSGILGPKRKQGDGQVPEGFYHIDRFNPVSNYYLSLGINYPNLSDKKKSTASNLGGDIFIHGSCVSIGCLPMTDDMIKEIYLYAVYAKNNGQSKIPVYIFPFQMTEQNLSIYRTKYKDQKDLIAFWTNLKDGYAKFFKDHKALKISVNDKGDYTFL